ncbi:AEC family transporter [Pararhodobacter sp. CCB-MM2]|uniref:AEC family transporter n=1 Tax=Pararhodobacter sp. CCB-MM2 TaxID=1786003 RepID=UPI00082D0AAC|nr:AEC family transporter [Pararhodobacter sp. CCB-MM2]
MLDMILTTLPIYLTIVLGYGALKSGYLKPEHVGTLSQFTLKITLPALIFFAIAMPRAEGGLNPSFLLAYALGSLFTLGIGYLLLRVKLKQPRPDSWILALGMANSNSGFLGFPIASLVFGEQGAVVFAMTMVIENVLIIPTATILATLAGGSGQSVKDLVRGALKPLLKNPLVIIVVISLLVRFSGLPLGAPTEKAISALAMAAAPVALFVIGGTVAGMSVTGHWRRSTAVALGKLVLHPVAVGAALVLIPGVPLALVPVGILFASVPMLTVFPILAAPFGLREVSSTALIATTLASVVTVTLVLSYLH